jgi:hypothetical protein
MIKYFLKTFKKLFYHLITIFFFQITAYLGIEDTGIEL